MWITSKKYNQIIVFTQTKMTLYFLFFHYAIKIKYNQFLFLGLFHNVLLSADFRVFFSSSFFHTTGLILHSVLSNSEIKYASHLIWRTICTNQNCDKAIPIYFKLGGSILLEKSAKNVTNLKYNISIFSRLQKYLPSQLKYLEIILLYFI